MAELDRISYVKVEDLIIITEEVFGELVRVYLDAHPSLKGQIAEDDSFVENFTQVMGLLMAVPEGSA